VKIIQPRLGHHLVASVKVDGEEGWQSTSMLDLVLEEHDDQTDEVTFAWHIIAIGNN
jgi:hypothetical protein